MMKIFKAFKEGTKNKFSEQANKKIVEKDKERRENLKEKHIDKMVQDSFPASDPPSTY